MVQSTDLNFFCATIQYSNCITQHNPTYIHPYKTKISQIFILYTSYALLMFSVTLLLKNKKSWPLLTELTSSPINGPTN